MSAVDRAARATYHPKGYGVSEGLARARKPFRVGNAITGAIITGFAFSVYIYSIRAVKQDDFSDIVGPDLEERMKVMSIEEEEAERIRKKQEMQVGFGDKFVINPVVVEEVVPAKGGIWQSVSGAFRKSS